MSTRATIAYKQEDGRYSAIYLHFDGYPDHTGFVLNEHFASKDLVRNLVAGGDIRSLGSDGTVERSVEGNRAVLMPTLPALRDFARNLGSEFVYVFVEGEWTYEAIH